MCEEERNWFIQFSFLTIKKKWNKKHQLQSEEEIKIIYVICPQK